MLKTWDEFFLYLSKQNNCSIHAKGFHVLDLQKFLKNYNYLISLHDPKDRAINLSCISLKNNLKSVYLAHTKGQTKKVNTPYQNKFILYSR